MLLTHYNIGSNIEQIAQTFMLGRRDRLLGILPFFHSFGFTVTLWLPAAIGTGVVYHPNPLDLAAISELTRVYKVTLLMATPTFLQAYMRRCQSEDFGSLQYVVTGAEKLPERTALAFEDKFGIRPLEGYGCTECSPVVSSQAFLSRVQIQAPGRILLLEDIAAQPKSSEKLLSLLMAFLLPACATAGTSPATSPWWTRTASW